jgi:hypothetical protein
VTAPLGAIVLALVCALLSALATGAWLERRGRARLALAQVDLISYAASAGGALSLLPEIVQAFAPELLSRPLAATALQNLDYAAYVLVPVGIGMGLARRWTSLRLERSLLPSAAQFTTN